MKPVKSDTTVFSVMQESSVRSARALASGSCAAVQEEPPAASPSSSVCESMPHSVIVQHFNVPTDGCSRCLLFPVSCNMFY